MGNQKLIGPEPRFAFLRTNAGRINDGMLYARTAIHGGARYASATANALFHQGVAWAHACAGQPHQSEHPLIASEKDFSQSNPAYDPEWIYWFSKEMIEAGAGRCYVKLNEPKRGLKRLSSALELCDPKWIRERAVHTSWLSEAHILDENIEEAAHYATPTAEIVAQTASARIDARVIEPSAKTAPFCSDHGCQEFQ